MFFHLITILIFFSNSLKIVCLCFQQTQYYESNAIGESNAGAPFPFVKTGRAFRKYYFVRYYNLEDTTSLVIDKGCPFAKIGSSA